MLNKPALLLCAAALAPSFANAALSLQDLFDGACLSGPRATACAWDLEKDFSTVTVDYSLIDMVFEIQDTPLGAIPTIGYEFNSQLSVQDGDEVDFVFSYILNADKAIMADSLELTDIVFAGTGGFIEVTEAKYSDGILVADLVAEIDPDFGIDNNPVTVSLGAPYYQLLVQKSVIIQSFAGGTVSVGDMHQGHALPAPASLALLASGLAGIAAVRRRRVRTGAPD